MGKYLQVKALLVVVAGASSVFAASPPGSINPGIDVAPLQGGGAVITPSLQATVPLGGGATLQGNAQLPIVVPPAGPAAVTPPNIGIRFSIPLR